jgi:transposase-like protein
MKLSRSTRNGIEPFKAEVLQACNQPGVSIAAVALTHGLNANLVRRWMNGRDLGSVVCPAPAVATAPTASSSAALPVQSSFLAVQLAEQSAHSPDIRLELHRAGATVSVRWPAHAAACGAWLREWLR